MAFRSGKSPLAGESLFSKFWASNLRYNENKLLFLLVVFLGFTITSLLKKTVYYFKNRLNLQHFSLTVSDFPSTRSVLSHLKCAKIILWLELMPWAMLGELLLLPHALRPSKQLRRYLNPIVNSFGDTPLNSTPANNPGYATGYTIVAVSAFGSLWRWSIALVLSCIVPWMDIWVAVLR